MTAARCFSLLLSAATALVAPRQTATRTIARLAAAEPVVDLRSDTVTQPTAAMRAAMGAAVCGDDVFGDDPTVAKLEARVGDLLGKEAAVFVPTGTMGNLVSILAHCWERGSEYVVGDCAHVHIFEQGGASQFGGAHARAVPTAADGTIGDAAAVRALVRVDDQHFPATKVVALEDTHNLRGGAALPAGYGAEVAAAVRDLGVAAHLDGARVWHAAAHRNEALAETAAPYDSLSVCLSKALGAPAGSVVAGSGDFVARCRRLRKGLGGTMRQTGVLAAAGLVALDEVLPKLSEDAARATALAAGLGALGFDVEAPQTNLLYFGLDEARFGFSARALVEHCADRGVRFLVVPGSTRMRMVCHHQITADGAERALAVIKAACDSGLR